MKLGGGSNFGTARSRTTRRRANGLAVLALCAVTAAIVSVPVYPTELALAVGPVQIAAIDASLVPTNSALPLFQKN